MHRFSFAVLVTCLVLAAVSARAGTLIIEVGQIYPGDAAGQSVVAGDARGNTLLVEGTLTGTGYGGVSQSGGDAVGNAAIVRGGYVDGSLIGGLSRLGSASGNTVIVDGGHVEGDVIGGRALQGDAVYNTVTLVGSPTFSATTHVWGGAGGASYDTTGNTLNLLGFRGTVEEVNDFQTYNFALQSDGRSGGPLVTITGNAVQLGTATVRLISVGGTAPWQVGDKVELFSRASGLPQQAKTTGVRQGLSMLYDFDLGMDGTALTASVTRAARNNPQAPAVFTPHASALALTTQALELVAGFGMESAWRAAASGGREAGGRWQPFAAVAGGTQRYDAGANISLHGVSGMTGLSRRWIGGWSSAMLGVFGEGGHGSYDSSETLGDGSSVSASGLLDYCGAGLLARVDGERGWWRGWHGELSFRAGTVGMDFHSSELDLPDLHGGVQRASFSTRTPYYSAHVGLGHRWGLGEATSLDVYGRGFWTLVHSSAATVLGEEVRFDAAQSWRVQGGTRLTHAMGERAQVYVGLGWEQELDGRVSGSVSGWRMPSASLRGGTAQGETGLSWHPDENWAVNLGVQVFTGTREGVLGRLELSYAF